MWRGGMWCARGVLRSRCFAAARPASELVSRAALARLRTGALWRQLTPSMSVRSLATSPEYVETPEPPQPPKKGLIQRFKEMYRDYWYVLVPVHLATSAVWFGGFYYVVMSGVDIVALLESLGLSERFTDPLRDSKAGYFALTYALYKIATPVRYAVTIGGTTLAINKLTAIGWIQPVPSKERLKEMIQEKKEGFQDVYEETKQELRQRRDQMKERRSQVLEDLKHYKQEMRDIKKSQIKTK